MTLSGARGIGRIATNPRCELQAAMVADRCSETDMYRSLTGQIYPREYGERYSARRRGAKFEANLYQNDAALLRRATGSHFGHHPEEMWVRNLQEELPGEKNDRRAMRAWRVRQILVDLEAGRPVPDLIIQPALPLRIGSTLKEVRFVSPDFMVLDRQTMIFVPGEIKSFIDRGAGPNPGDLAPTRLQAAVSILALRGEAVRVGLSRGVMPRASFVFATPFGLSPTDAVEENLHAELEMVTRALEILAGASQHLALLRKYDGAELANLVTDLETNYQEGCISSCALADVCRSRQLGRPAELGDVAVDILGPEADLDRLAQLVLGAKPKTPFEEAVAPSLRDAWQALGFDDFDTGRQVA